MSSATPMVWSGFMTTYTGKRFHLFDPRAEEICIEDIAHALSQLCRFTGHCRHFYSVGQHSWHASYLVPPAFAMEALLHDAAEAYINDLSRPLKHDPRMAGYIDVEQRIDTTIRHTFGLPIIAEPPYMSPEIKDVDNKLVYTEAKQLVAESDWADRYPRYEDLELPVMLPTHVEAAFLMRYKELIRASRSH